MCFSPQADLVGGAIIGAIGVDAIRHVDLRHGHIAIACLPLLLALHQVDESLVWFGLQGKIPDAVSHVALWIYVLIAFVVLPLFVPLAVIGFEPTKKQRWLMAPFVAIGAFVSGSLLSALIRGPFGVHLRPYHLDYTLTVHDGLLIVVLYVVAVCGALIFSGSRHIVAFGVVNLLAVAVIARLTIDGFASVWCGWAAICSAAIALQLRFGGQRHHQKYAPSGS